MRRLLFIFFSLFLYLNVMAGDSASHSKKRDCPSFIIDRNKGKKLQGYFEEKYLRLLSNSNVIYEPLRIELNNLEKLLTEIQNNESIPHLIIYLAQDENNRLKFLFRGLDKNQYSSGSYYEVIDNGENYRALDDKEADNWITKYQMQTLPIISNGIDEKNTKAYLFTKFDIGSFLKEIHYQLGEKKLMGIKMKLGTYFDESMTPEGTKENYIGRIMIGFTFTRKNGLESNLDRRWGRCGCRIPPVPNSFIEVKYRDGSIGADTGSPCPPSSNCPK